MHSPATASAPPDRNEDHISRNGRRAVTPLPRNSQPTIVPLVKNTAPPKAASNPCASATLFKKRHCRSVGFEAESANNAPPLAGKVEANVVVVLPEKVHPVKVGAAPESTIMVLERPAAMRASLSANVQSSKTSLAPEPTSMTVPRVPENAVLKNPVINRLRYVPDELSDKVALTFWMPAASSVNPSTVAPRGTLEISTD